jgi:mRNA-degrading endonuclease RelE of RelBE toxin-antitoxin system
MQPPRRIKLPGDVAGVIRSFHPLIKRKIRLALEEIQADPKSGKELRGELIGYRSFRIGKIRIIYREKDSMIEVVTVGPREVIYFETAVLLKQLSHKKIGP